jgi:Zn-dependent protease with chaperone function
MDSSAPAALPWRRRLDTPTRVSLLQHYRRAESLAVILLIIEAVAGVLALAWLVFRAPRPLGQWPWIAASVGGLGVFRWFLHHVFLNKKRLDQIRSDAQFGVHNRETLLALTRHVFARLGVPRSAAPVFLTRDKDINARALRCELWPGLRLFNGVFLNRSVIHLLDEAELASVIGHELGHVYPYAPLVSRMYALHAVVAALVSAAIASVFPVPGVAFLAPLAVLWVLDLIIALPHHRLSRGIEFLCDDYGAQAAGLLPALSAEVKIAIESETRQTLFHQTLAAKAGGIHLSLTQLVEAYDAAIPFGKADPATFAQELKQVAREQVRQDRGLSAGGFARYLGRGDEAQTQDWIEEHLALSRALAALLQGSAHWTTERAAVLLETIAANPDRVFARLPDEVDDRALTHPAVSRRLLFLWRERAQYPERT